LYGCQPSVLISGEPRTRWRRSWINRPYIVRDGAIALANAIGEDGALRGAQSDDGVLVVLGKGFVRLHALLLLADEGPQLVKFDPADPKADHQTVVQFIIWPCLFVGPSRRELKALPEEVRGRFGHALHQAQCGEEPAAAKAPKGFGGRGVLEVVEDFDRDTYRAVYTVRFAGLIYVPHAFQKKSKKGIATPEQTIELIKSRLRHAEEDYRARRKEGERKP